ncbi:hypothetical protein BSKO_04638 [Bryopsis sp. KO-2023]|nr:hypothetical protein BSKO_04638 [Bryopsis sp. KO-2023]
MSNLLKLGNTALPCLTPRPARFDPCRIGRALGSERSVIARKANFVEKRLRALSREDVSDQEGKPIAMIENWGEPPPPSRTFLFSCDDSDLSVTGARFLFDHVVGEGDTVHFVHVLNDDRDEMIGVDDMYSQPSNLNLVQGDDEAKEHYEHLGAVGARMMQDRFGAFMKTNIRMQFHLPLMRGPESASDIGETLCKLAEDINADMLVVVTPCRGAFSECGSVGHHCYEHARIPILVVPPKALDPEMEFSNSAFIIAKDSNEAEKLQDWVRLANLSAGGVFMHTLNIEDEVSGAVCVDRLKEETHAERPKFIAMFSQADMSLMEELAHPPFVANFCARSHYPVVLVPTSRKSPESRESKLKGWEGSTVETSGTMSGGASSMNATLEM